MAGSATEDDVRPPTDLRLVPAALAVWGGSLAGLAGGNWQWAVAGAVAACATVIVVVGLRRRVRWAAGLAAAAAFAIAGLVVSHSAVQHAGSDPLQRAAQLGSWADVIVSVAADAEPVRSGIPHSDADASGVDQRRAPPDRWRIATRARSVTAAGQQWETDVAVTVFGDSGVWAALPPGSVLRVGGLLAEDRMSALPGVVLGARGAPEMLTLAPLWRRLPFSIRQHLLATSRVLPPDQSGLLAGFVIGDTREISDRLDADAKATGLTHLVAVSGSHFALLVGLVVALLRRAGPWAAGAGGALALAALVLLVGGQPSVLRAAVMAGVALLALVTGRGRSALPALSAAVIGLLLMDPSLAVSAGFSLSVQATAALVLLAPAWSGALVRRGVPRGWADVLVIPVAASVATMPVIAAISGRVSLISIPANILAAPVVGLALVIGMLCALVAPWWPAAGVALARMDGPLLGWVAGVAHHLARWPGAGLPWPATVGGLAGLCVALICTLVLLRAAWARAAAVAAAIGIAVVIVPAQVVSPGWPMAGWLVTGCEVGQGDATVLATGAPGVAVVVDAGPDSSLVDRCLDGLQVGTIPLLVLTHLHADHVGGLSGVLSGRSVGAILVGPGREPASSWRAVLAQATTRQIPVLQAAPGNRWAIGDLHLTVLGPAREFHGTASDPNNDSVVLAADVGGIRVMLTGDVEPEAQRALLASGADLRADILKQPHHGSARVLPEFLAAVAPKVSLIEVGQDNDYGHPSAAVLDRLTLRGIPVLRTDIDGTVQIGVVDGQLVAVERGPSLRAEGGRRAQGGPRAPPRPGG